jgi:hypothetical protein
MNRPGAVGKTGIFLIALGVLLTIIGSLRSAPPPQCTLPPRDGADDRLTALERRVAELCERLDRRAAQPAPSAAAGLEVQSASPAAYTAACGPNGCGIGPTGYSTTWPVGGPFVPAGAYFSGQTGYSTTGGGCAGGSCSAQAPAGGLLRGGGLFRGRR